MSGSESHSLLGYSVSFSIDDDGRCAEASATLTSRWRGLTLDEAFNLEPDVRFDPPPGLDSPDKRRDWASVKLVQLGNPAAVETQSVGDWFVLFMLDDDGRCQKAAAIPTQRGETIDELFCDDHQTWLNPPKGLDTPDKRRDWAAAALS
ncbi:MAG TPA: hypothetical protein VGH79_01515 [Gaiellaceae bacterium]|jgi:hypothetical protein